MTTDQVGRGNTVTECCPTDKMLGDCMTKGLQGMKSLTFRRRIMGMEPNLTMTKMHDIQSELMMTFQLFLSSECKQLQTRPNVLTRSRTRPGTIVIGVMMKI